MPPFTCKVYLEQAPLFQPCEICNHRKFFNRAHCTWDNTHVMACEYSADILYDDEAPSQFLACDERLLRRKIQKIFQFMQIEVRKCAIRSEKKVFAASEAPRQPILFRCQEAELSQIFVLPLESHTQQRTNAMLSMAIRREYCINSIRRDSNCDHRSVTLTKPNVSTSQCLHKRFGAVHLLVSRSVA